MGLGPLPDVPGTLRYVLSGTIGDKTWSNTFHVNYPGLPPTTPQATAIANGIAEAWSPYISGLCQVDVVLTKVEVVDLSARDGAVGVWLGSIPGGLTDGDIGANSCVLVDYGILIRFRGGHPKNFLPGGGVAELENHQTWTSDFVTACTSGFQNFLDQVENVTVDGFVIGGQCFVQYVAGDPPAYLAPPITRKIVSFSINQNVSTQKRRLNRR
jgi:hypothetical protein